MYLGLNDNSGILGNWSYLIEWLTQTWLNQEKAIKVPIADVIMDNRGITVGTTDYFRIYKSKLTDSLVIYDLCNTLPTTYSMAMDDEYFIFFRAPAFPGSNVKD